MPRTYQWREKDGPTPYVETSEFDEKPEGAAAGPKITRAEVEQIVEDKLKGVTGPGGEVTKPMLEAAKKEAIQAAADANQQAVDGLKQRFGKDLGDVNQALTIATNLAKDNTKAVQAADQKAEGAASAAKTNATAITNLTADAATVKQTATDAKAAAAKANSTLVDATKTLQDMKAHDEALGRVMKAVALEMYSGDKLIEELKKNGATEADLRLFGILK